MNETRIPKQAAGWIILLCVVLPVAGGKGENAPAPAAATPDFVVAVDGSDDNPGTREKPFATMDRARIAVRAGKAENPNRPRVVALRGGTYFLKEPVVFAPEDSGSEGAPVIYQAWPGEKPVLSGGREVTGWKRDGERLVVTLPEAAGGGWSFTRLFVDGQSRYRPRLPRQGYFHVRAELAPAEANKNKGYDGIGFQPGDLRATWHNLGDVEVLGMQIWSMARLRLATVDEQQGVARFTGTTSGTPFYQKLPADGRYLVENVREAAVAGDYYLDTKSGELSYWPLAGEQPSRVIAPRLGRLIELRGDPAQRVRVQNLVFRGLGFAHTHWQTPPQGFCALQAEEPLGAAIVGNGAHHVTFEDCAVTQTGEYAIHLADDCSDNRISGCSFTDLGAGGVRFGTPAVPASDDRVSARNCLEDCLIAHGGRMHPAAVGVWIGQSSHNRVCHNEIFDFYYTGVSLGWTWGYHPSHSMHNEIGHNHIHLIGQGVLSDMGGIYSLGPGPGNHLHHNLIHEIDSFTYGGWGIYFDEGTSEMLAENNVVHHTSGSGFNQHYGKNNTIRNNISAFGRTEQLSRGRPEPDHFTLTVRNHIVIYQDAPLLAGNWDGDNYKFESNLYWRADGQPVQFPGGLSLEQRQAKGQDGGSLVADPLFVDPGHGDFRMRPGSPAEKIGFRPIDVSQVGRRTAKADPGNMQPRFPLCIRSRLGP